MEEDDDIPGFAQDKPRERPTVPKELGDKWIAWNSDATKIITSGDTLDNCDAAASNAGEANPRFEKVPRPNVRITGVGR